MTPISASYHQIQKQNSSVMLKKKMLIINKQQLNPNDLS